MILHNNKTKYTPAVFCFLLLIFSTCQLCLYNKDDICNQCYRRSHSSDVMITISDIPEECQQLIRQLGGNYENRKMAIQTIKEIILNGKNEQIKLFLALEISNRLFSLSHDSRQNEAAEILLEAIPCLDKMSLEKIVLNILNKLPNYENLKEAISVLEKVVPLLQTESLREESARVIGEVLMTASSYTVREAAISALGEIIPTLSDDTLKETSALKILHAKTFSNLGPPKRIAAFRKIMPFLRLEFIRELKQQLSLAPDAGWKDVEFMKAVSGFLDLIDTQDTQNGKQKIVELLRQEPILQYLNEEVEAICRKTTKPEEVLDGITRLVEIFSKVKNQTFWGKKFSEPSAYGWKYKLDGRFGLRTYFDIDKLFDESRDYKELIANYESFIQWLLRNKDNPIYSHDITEKWTLRDDKCRSLTGSFRVDFYAGGFLKIGTNSIFGMDNDGVEIYTCADLNSYFGNQNLSREIMTRTFLTGYQIATVLGYKPVWAYAFYDIAHEDNISKGDFLYPILDSLFEKLGSGSSVTEEEAIARSNLTDLSHSIGTVYFDSWAMLFRNFLVNVNPSWKAMFYKERIEYFSIFQRKNADAIWQDIESTINWEEIEQQRITNQNQTLLSILEQLIEKLPPDDPKIGNIQAKIDELRGSLSPPE